MPSRRRQWLSALGALAACWSVSAGTADAQDRPVTVFAASSLQTALDAIVTAWRRETGQSAVVSYAASSALARQIEQGAPADLFISADREWMAYLADRNLLDVGTETELLENRLVLVAAVGTIGPVDISPALDLAALLGDGRLAIAEPDTVPAGRYARAALEALGLWDGIADRLAPAENVRAALAFVSRGEAPLGIVYATDDIADPAVEAIAAFPAGSLPRIIYPAALTATASPDAGAFLAYLRSPAAVCIFVAQGFGLIDADGEAILAPPACPTGG